MNKHLKGAKFAFVQLCFVLFVIAMNSCIAYAGEEHIIMRDYAGNDITCLNSYYETENAVSFDIKLDVSECDYLAYQISSDDGESFSEYIAIEEGELTFYPEKVQKLRIRFCVICEETNEISFVNGMNDYYGISFCSTLGGPLAKLNGDEYLKLQNEYYFGKEAPYLQILGSELSDTYIEIKEAGSSNANARKITATERIDFETGIYDVAVYNIVDGKRVYASGFPLKIIYDNQPPFDMEFKTEYPRGGYYDAKREGINMFSHEEVVIEAKGHDKLSGIAGIVFLVDGKEYEGNSVNIKSGSCEDISAYCIDKCGNRSAIYKSDLKVLIDNEAPEIEISNVRERYLIEIHDKNSPIKESRVLFNSEEVKKDVNNGDKAEYYSKTYEVFLQNDYSDENVIEITAVDFAGNKKIEQIMVKNIDSSGPRIVISGINNRIPVNDDVNAKVHIYDKNLDDTSVLISAINESTGKEYTYSKDDELLFEDSGSYTLSITASDRSGNVTSMSEHFEIDKNPPSIVGLNKYKGKTVKSFSLAEEMDTMFEDDTVVQYQIYVNGMNHSENDSIVKPGRYKVDIFAIDQAGNRGFDSADFIIEGEKTVYAKNEGIKNNHNKVRAQSENEIRVNNSFKNDENGREDFEASREKENGKNFMLGAIVVILVIISAVFILIGVKHCLVKRQMDN